MSMLLALALAQPPIDADAAIAAQRRMVAGATAECDESDDPDTEVVVCGRREDRRYRLPYPGQRDRSDLRLPGEDRAVSLTTTAGSCGVVGRGGGCTGGLDVLAIAGFLGRLAVGLVDPELVADPPPPIPPVPDP